MSATNEIRAELHAQIDRLVVSSSLDASDSEAMRTAIIAALAIHSDAERSEAGKANEMAAVLLDLRRAANVTTALEVRAQLDALDAPAETGSSAFADGFMAGRDSAEEVARKRWRESRLSGERITSKVIANEIQKLSPK